MMHLTPKEMGPLRRSLVSGRSSCPAMALTRLTGLERPKLLLGRSHDSQTSIARKVRGVGSEGRSFMRARVLSLIALSSRRRDSQEATPQADQMSQAVDFQSVVSELQIIGLCTALVLALGFLTSEPGSLLVQLDEALHDLLLQHTGEADHALFGDLSNKLDDVLKFLSCLVAFLSLASKERRFLALSAPGGLEVVRLCQRSLKETFHRSRPTSLLSDYSYPSAHTARFVFCCALIFLVLLPRLKEGERAPSEQWLYVVLGAGAVMGSCRMLADAHWFFDTVGGACMGLEVAALLEFCVILAEKGPRNGFQVHFRGAQEATALETWRSETKSTLTKKSRRGQERTQEIRDKIKMGILQPPPPKAAHGGI